MARYAMVIDLNRCVGCRTCMVACKAENNTPQGAFWMFVFREERGKFPNVTMNYVPRPCMHCDNAPCAKVCPVGARYKRADGLVLTDYDRCIGCRYCVVACPYNVNYFNWKIPSENQYFNWVKGEGDNQYGKGRQRDYTRDARLPNENPDHEELYGEEKLHVSGGGHYVGVVEKCTWCVHRLEKGLEPACVANCPVNTLHFGDLDDSNSEVLKLIGKKRWFRLLEEKGTEPRVYYLARFKYT